jgi:hypothetical protein
MSTEAVMTGEEQTGCQVVQSTKKYCVLGCDLLEDGENIVTPLVEIEPVTDVAFGPDSGEDPTSLCVTPSTTPMYVLGCVGDEAEGSPSCVSLEVCPPEEPPPEE